MVRKAQGNNERKGRIEGTEERRREQRQRQTATAARLAVARAPLFPPGFFISLLALRPLPPLLAEEREERARRGTVGFIVFELDASLFCFVSRAIRGANCRSYAIAFCFLLLPPFLHDPLSLFLSRRVSTLRSPPPPPPAALSPATSLFFCSTRTPTDATDHDADREGRLSHSLHFISLSSSAFLRSSNIVVYLYSSSRRFLVAPDFLRSDAENLSFRPLSFPRREKQSVFVSHPPLRLSRSLIRPRATDSLSVLSSAARDRHGKKREKEDKAVLRRREQREGRFNASTPR